jgi:predicted secreted protein
MNWFTGIACYVVIWWVVIFAILPFGVKPAPEDDIGHSAGAPAQPHMMAKVIATTLVSAILWIGLYLIVSSDIWSFRQS